MIELNEIIAAGIMHQPGVVADEEGVGIGDSEIVHALAALHNFHLLDRPVLAVGLAHGHSWPQVAGIDPAAQQDIEGVLWRRLDRLATQGELDDHRVEVREGRRDGVDARRPRRLVIREDRLPNFF